MKLHPHHIETLAAELARDEYRGKSADEAFALVNSKPVITRLGRTVYPATPGYQSGVPGFPNSVRRADFDAIWKG